MADPNSRGRRRLHLSDPAAWDFLLPWFEQLKERLLVVEGGYMQVLHPQARHSGRNQTHQSEEKLPQRYETSDWRTREALELLVLVHAVNNRAWPEILLESCALRFDEEEDKDRTANNDDEEEEEEEEDDSPHRRSGVSPDESLFKFECEHERELPLSPRFTFNVELGAQKPGELSPVAKWGNFFLPHLSDYEPSPEFLEAKKRILMMRDEEFTRHPRVPQSIEIPVAVSVHSSRDENAEFVAHMKDLRGLIDKMKEHAATAAGEVDSVADCARTFTYRLDLISLKVRGVDMTEACVESVLDVLRTGIPIAALEVDLHNGVEGAQNGVTRAAIAQFLIGVLLDPSHKIRSLGTFELIDEHEWHCEALYSTLAVAQTPVANLVTHGRCVRHNQLKLLAEALFSPQSPSRAFYPSVHGLDISYDTADLETIVNVVKEKDNNSGIAWQLREGTPVIFAKGQTNEAAVVTKYVIPIPVDTNRKLLSANTVDKRGLVEVALPGYGKCLVPREALDRHENFGLDASAHAAEPVSSLSIYFYAGVEVLETLLSQIGWSLRSLSLQYFDRLDDEKVMTAVLKWCPKLTKLSIFPDVIDLNRLITTYENFTGKPEPRISSVSLVRVSDIGADHGVVFARLLGDLQTRLALHLEELTIETFGNDPRVTGATMQALWMALKTNTKLRKLKLTAPSSVLKPWKNRFRHFHCQVLPSVPVDLPSKLAFLSAFCMEGDATLPAFQRLDQLTVSRVFEFAATRVIRSVTMFYSD